MAHWAQNLSDLKNSACSRHSILIVILLGTVYVCRQILEFKFVDWATYCKSLNKHWSSSQVRILTDTDEDLKLVHRRKRPKVDMQFFSLFFRRVQAKSMTQCRVENTRVHFWTSRMYRLKMTIKNFERVNNGSSQFYWSFNTEKQFESNQHWFFSICLLMIY